MGPVPSVPALLSSPHCCRPRIVVPHCSPRIVVPHCPAVSVVPRIMDVPALLAVTAFRRKQCSAGSPAQKEKQDPKESERYGPRTKSCYDPFKQGPRRPKAKPPCRVLPEDAHHRK